MAELKSNMSKIANPAPLGLMGFGMTTILLNLHNAGFFALGSMILAIGMFYGGLAQVIVGLMEWKLGQHLRYDSLHFLRYVLDLTGRAAYPAQDGNRIGHGNDRIGRLPVHVGNIHLRHADGNPQDQQGHGLRLRILNAPLRAAWSRRLPWATRTSPASRDMRASSAAHPHCTSHQQRYSTKCMAGPSFPYSRSRKRKRPTGTWPPRYRSKIGSVQ